MKKNKERDKYLLKEQPQKIDKLDFWSILAMIFTLVYLLAHFFWVYPVFGGELNGRQLMKESWDSYRAIPEEEEVIEIFTIPRPHQEWYTSKEAEVLLQNRSWSVTYKKIIRQLRYKENGEDRIRVIFLEPPRDKDTAFLFWRHWGIGKADDVWGWFSALRRIRRIASPDQRDHFMGTALTFEDVRRLMGENLNDFIITLASEEELEGVECYKIILEPKSETNSAYGRREFWRVKNGLPSFLQIKYYNQKGDLIKAQRNSQIYKFQPGVWRSRLVEMRNLKNNYTSLLYFIKREVKKFEDKIFKIQTLEQQGR
ncbi:MAG: hypothetical protein A3I88_01005 [Candidatus Portnoybacteria bacterium RIFCSPLOWO2_12_FULL_39_9]|uniref:Uncharacterized protein TP-0789 domain-containing protein n=1 Tax=Candidatus Portnoybacteria bacterium RIFCSPHIGHO2_12_FULL_38_9 TaxID=1801997 RepID=A0A1G2FII7_9BACT|nr:MAG: hypothetical protein A3H00_00015 [Candidatus Portnoybacteria bacterium RBG_13_40_8]OGZ36693.1 MAG: hypothetical protein A2646_02220 [Candidatus Portnoybacteria bacterium RIFCSPHIGHO2_02_FULL_39_12]OGZ37602.1 MAG: hypothetical protein A3J64_01935 [Candidatus Portnoybacteria bacterium RIFCSPHIGHO2_12_FULL_38_9]OGZ38955.1 MAG: hypothetical protein A3F21_03775 [Candidatus Portnoybacteria bacterium RIFCSPLOWO2_01_FULL_38_39]OGZ41199.1 MAG: hypothetical protein A3I88_01005 [Candidatus Portnoy